jgi:hypothetical protein
VGDSTQRNFRRHPLIFFFSDSIPGSPDLSGCTSLENLRFPIPFDDPMKVAGPILLSIRSPPPTIGLWFVMDWKEVNRRAWNTLEEGLCSLADKFAVMNDGRKMVVEVFFGCDNSALYTLFRDGRAMPHLNEKAEIVLRETFKDSWIDGGNP